MENWAFEPAFLETFAKDYRTGEVIPGELLERIVNAKNYLSGYYQVRQLDFGILDMAWHTLESMPQEGTIEFETRVLEPYRVLPYVSGTAISTSFSHIFSGGYSAGYYSYKWAEVLEADAFSLFEQNGISIRLRQNRSERKYSPEATLRTLLFSIGTSAEGTRSHRH